MTDLDQLINNLLDLQVPGNLHLSKGGQNLVYATTLPLEQKKDKHSVSTIWHAQSGKVNSARQLTSGLYNDRHPQISPDGRTVAFVSDRAQQDESSAIYILSLTEGGEAYSITPTDNERSIDLIKWSPDGEFIAYLSADEKTQEQKSRDKDKDDAAVYGKDWPFNRLSILRVSTKTIETVVKLDKHISEFDWHPEDNSIAFVTQRIPEIEACYMFERSFYILPTIAPTASPKHLGDFPCAVLSIAQARDAIYFVGSASQRTPVGSFALFKIEQDKPSIFQKVAHGDTDCCKKVRKVDGDLMCSTQNGLNDELEMVGGKTVAKLPCEIGDWAAAFPKDSDELIIALTKSDINTPSEVYTTTASGGAMVKLSNHGASVDKKPAQSRFITCKSSDDDTDIQAVFFTTQDAWEKDILKSPLPTIVHIHGGPYDRNTDKYNPATFFFAEPLLEAGYAVLQINYRGSSGRGEEFAAKARGAMGSYDHSDIVCMTKHCIDLGYVDKDKIIVGGWSQGGFLTYLSSVRNGMHGLQFKGAIAGAGVTDWDTMTFTSDVGLIQAKFAGGAAWSSEKEMLRGRNGSAIWEFKKAAEKNAIPPILMLHGKDDVRVPIEQARAFRRGLEHYDLPFELVEYPREGHRIKERKHLEDMIKRVARFCDQHTKS